MLSILGSANPCRPVHRREVLRIGALSGLGLALPQMLEREAVAAAVRPRNVLLLYLQGAASQYETWDPKPDAPAEIRGQWGAIPTSVPGVQICDQLPRLAPLMDRMAIVRSMSHEYNNHSNLYTLSGYPAVDFSSETNPFDSRHHPFFCSVLDYIEQQRAPNHVPEMPRNIGLPYQFSAHGQLARRAGPYGAFLGSGYNPVWTEFDGEATQKVGRVSFFDRLATVDVADPYLGVTPESRLRISKSAQLQSAMTLDRLDRRRSLQDQLDIASRRVEDTLATQGVDRFEAMAYSLMTSEKLRRALDIGLEPIELRERYGMTLFGQSALTARRLLEAGCGLVSVFWDEYKIVNTAWDTHFDHFTRLGDELLPGLDAAVSTLLLDLEERGLLDETLVLCLTEHGRTAKIDSNRGGGRDHWSRAYSVMLAGAGIRPGSVVGATEATGAFVAQRPVTPEDILATVYHLKGIDETAAIPDRLGRPVRLTERGQVIPELLA
jgi:uncharacterized protein (DUF1501 family)